MSSSLIATQAQALEYNTTSVKPKQEAAFCIVMHKSSPARYPGKPIAMCLNNIVFDPFFSSAIFIATKHVGIKRIFCDDALERLSLCLKLVWLVQAIFC